MPKSPDVDAWFKASEHPQKKVMQAVRKIILGADRRMSECIKWKTPTFMYEGNLASFNPQAKSFVSLMFHTGAKIPGSHPRLEGGAQTARYMKIADAADAKALKPDLVALVKAWCALKEGGATKKKTKKKSAKKKTTKKKVAKKKTTKKKVAKKKTTKKKVAKKKTTKKKTTKKKVAKKKATKKTATKVAKKRATKKKPRVKARGHAPAKQKARRLAAR